MKHMSIFKIKTGNVPVYTWALLVFISWTLLIAFSLAWNITNEKNQAYELIKNQAQSNFDKNIAIRLWATSHGGVYVPADKRTPPNPYLKNVQEQDITTPSGRHLTLMNPAYIMRQIMSDYSELYGIKGYFRSRNPLNPANFPDEWEKKALLSFEKGIKEVSEITNIDNQLYLRLIRPVITKKGCLKCHGDQGYKVNDIRGAMSIAVPMDMITAFTEKAVITISITHSILWLLGIIAIALYFNKLKAWTLSMISAEQELNRHRDHLEELVAERTMELFRTNEKLQAEIIRRNDIEEDLKTAKEAAEAASHAKSEFLANMSHEIRTPMNAILGYAELLENSLTNETNLQYISSIRAAGKSLLGLICDILDLSKIEAGKLKPEYGEMNPVLVIQEIEQIFSYKIREKCLKLILEIDESIPGIIIFDEVRLRQILLNLVGNAVKFTDSGYILLSIECKYSYDDDNSLADLIITVEDTGIGIPKDQRERIFNPFEQQEGQVHASFGGTGLGLSITKRLTEMLNGEIYIKGEQGKGSIFCLCFRKIKFDNTSQQPGNINKIIDDSIPVNFKNAKILIADDVQDNRELVKEFLDFPEISIIEAENGKQAVDLANTYLPDLIIMDIKMPVLDGYEAVKLIKKNPDLKKVPVIGFTAMAMKNDIDKMQSIFNDFLFKPVGKSELFLSLKKYLKYEFGKEIPEIKESFFQELPDEAKENLPEFIEILNNNIEKSKEISELLTINEIDDFAKKMKLLAEQYKNPALLQWGEKLELQAKNFDIEALPKTLNKFEDIVKNTKSLYYSSNASS